MIAAKTWSAKAPLINNGVPGESLPRRPRVRNERCSRRRKKAHAAWSDQHRPGEGKTIVCT
jgi:hypothetical protein